MVDVNAVGLDRHDEYAYRVLVVAPCRWTVPWYYQLTLSDRTSGPDD